MMSRLRKFAMVPVVAALAGTVGGALALADTSAPTAVVGNSDSPAVGVSALTSRFGILRTSTTEVDAIPTQFTGPLPGVHASEARLLRTQIGHGRAWVVPTDDGYCVVAEAGGAGCTHAAQGIDGDVLTLGGVGGGGLRDGQVLVFGLAPDGVTAATLQMKDGSKIDITVIDNTFSADVNGSTSSVSYTDADGAVHTLPARSFEG